MQHMISLFQGHRGWLFLWVLIMTSLFSWGGENAIASSGEWSVTLTVSTPYSTVPGGVVSNTLVAGVRNGATDGYDNAMDTVSLLEPDDPIQAHFPHGAAVEEDSNDGSLKDWGCPIPEAGYNAYQCSLWRDFRPLSDSNIWTVEVISTLNGATINLGSKINGEPADIAGVELTLVDLSASPPLPPMRIDSLYNYQYTNMFIPGKRYGLRRFEIQMKTTGLFITPETLLSGALNAPYSQAIHAVGGAVIWSLESGALPPGLSLDAYSGRIEGIPFIEGTFPFTVRGEDTARGIAASHKYSLSITPPLVITTLELPEGEIYKSYIESIIVSGGTYPLTWSLISGSLPAGVSLDKRSGILSGTFEVPGIFYFTIKVEDVTKAWTSQAYQIVVKEPADTLPPAAITDLHVVYLFSTAVILAWSAPLDDSLTGTAAAYDLRYSKDCPGGPDTTWWDTALQAIGEPRPQSGTLHTYTLGGLEAGQNYCAAVQSMDASGHVSAISNVVRFPSESDDELSQGGANFSGLTTRQHPLQKGYNLISIPMTPLPSDTSIFENTLGGTTAVYRWYSAYPGLTPAQWYLEDNIHPGYGYFLYVPDQGIILNISGIEITDPQYVVPLQGGWNMIGNPYEADITLKDVLIREVPDTKDTKDTGDRKSKSFEDAAKSGWVGNSLYAFNGMDYEFLAVNDDPPAVLKPWIGFWLYVQEDNNYEIIFSKPQK